MNEQQIAELFIRAAVVDKKLPDTARPKKVKAINYGYVHDKADMNGWMSEDKEAANWAWLEPENLKNTTNDMGLWEVSMLLIRFSPTASHRRALWAWAQSEAGGIRVDGHSGSMSFARWCREVEGISRQLGNWRKDRALSRITLAYLCKLPQHNDKQAESDFTNHPENWDKKHTLRVERLDDARPMACNFDLGLTEFSWAEAQNAKRRQREAKRRHEDASVRA